MTEPAVSPSATAQEAWRILLVDDEPTQRLIMARLLKRAGYSVEMAGNGREALTKIAAGDFQLMITDWEMPEMDGIALCRELRSLEGKEGKAYIYTILLTARDAIEHVVTGLQSGADDYLTKPVIEPELMARLSTGKRIVTLERSLRAEREQNRRLSITDPLTSAYNRRYLTEQLPREIERAARYGREADDLLTAMHEVIGHGSGKLSDRLKGGSEPYLKEYFSTLEEARADLMALWNVWDPELKKLGLANDQENVARTMYDSQARVALTQLRRIPRGDTISEDHARDRALIVNYIKDKTGAIEFIRNNGKTYVHVKDYQKMREGAGMLLRELMRIKAEGDYAAAKTLVDQYGVHFDPNLRDEVVARYRQLNLPTYWAGVNTELTADFDDKGNVKTVRIGYPRDAVKQYLAYGQMYRH